MGGPNKSEKGGDGGRGSLFGIEEYESSRYHRLQQVLCLEDK